MLAIDTSTLVLGVAVVEEGKVLGEVTNNLHKTHSERLMPTIAGLLKDLSIELREVTAISVTSGPGSYTGIRIGVTTAKTLAWTHDLPLYAESSLTVLAMNGKRFPGLVVPLLDARRNRVYTGVYRPNASGVSEVLGQQVLEITDLLEQCSRWKEPILFLGDDVSKFRDVIEEALGENAYFGSPAENLPRASELGEMSLQRMIRGEEPLSQQFALNYLQVTEAEANWLKKQKQGTGTDVN
ncbi:tRNA (adenosine(37)-N6)-threonylcarbamoyltransferase complex dimerization subunit type 1 TsaB [Thermoactinomyces sp. DSM 45892]|uniref:tRNA (adenosine(37)-N6)-threonylcarbamoyltransferase complex dimerization subunit type 1 TsaB n=1 Tax=Thermoactinomyces sp. DSM 45892 TaxID=1882753 RepID=UPI002100F29C|nr:tRNA (adenosine(37)-N6)-threonylcarbamoyltransferase complex dimerization subunit type 1 TsaB [Thermoactinomyces sp. DSM 45892]